MTPGKGVQQGQATHKALLITGLKRVAVRLEPVQSIGNIAIEVGGIGGRIVKQVPAPVGVRTCLCGFTIKCSLRQERINLVGIDEALQMNAMVANIGQVEQYVLGQLLLHTEEVALNVAVLGV